MKIAVNGRRALSTLPSSDCRLCAIDGLIADVTIREGHFHEQAHYSRPIFSSFHAGQPLCRMSSPLRAPA
jgi:hypothetical protein